MPLIAAACSRSSESTEGSGKTRVISTNASPRQWEVFRVVAGDLVPNSASQTHSAEYCTNLQEDNGPALKRRKGGGSSVEIMNRKGSIEQSKQTAMRTACPVLSCARKRIQVTKLHKCSGFNR